jgi:transcriptional regulator with GAF, ATPase, and Fis domain
VPPERSSAPEGPALLTERLRRLEALDPLFVTVAETLDIREVFQQVAAVAREAVPHDFLTLGLFSEDRWTARLYALSEGMLEGPVHTRLTPATRDFLSRDIVVAHDIRDHADPKMIHVVVRDPATGGEHVFESEPTPLMRQMIRDRAIHSVLYAAVHVRGAIAGGLLFHAGPRGAYGQEDARMAKRIADCVALALAHERLAEEARLAGEARERAARLEVRVARLTEELAASGGPHRQIGVSTQWRDVLAQATKVAPTEATVLVTGESGTGKEVVARFLHHGSPRKDGPFSAINCAALPEQLLESELFGHEKGAFTGAAAARAGRLEQAAGGVLFLDEVGEMSLAVQAKFLRVLQEREFQRLGSSTVKKTDVRVIAATNRDLKAAIANGQFREDLYYRLHVFELHLPPLRERTDDIVALLDHFLTEVGASIGRPAAGISREAKDKMMAYPWPGNVRELRNAVERAVILCEGGLISSEHLPISLNTAARPDSPASAESSAPPAVLAAAAVNLPPEGIDLADLERTLVEQALERAGANRSKAARLLGLTRAQLYGRLEKYGLASPSSDSDA